MPLKQIFLSQEENNKLRAYAQTLDISTYEALKRMVREFQFTPATDIEKTNNTNKRR